MYHCDNVGVMPVRFRRASTCVNTHQHASTQDAATAVAQDAQLFGDPLAEWVHEDAAQVRIETH